MNNVRDDLPQPLGDDALAAEYVLGVLPPDERVAVARRIDNEPAMNALVAGWQTRLSEFDAEFAPHTPPPAMKAAIDKRLFAQTALQPVRWWNRLAVWRAATLATASVAMIAMGTALYAPSQVPPPSMVVATLSAATPADTFSIVYNRGEGAIVVSRADGDALTDNDFEVWAIVGTNAPVSLGVLPRDGNGVLALDGGNAALLAPSVVLAVSLEPAGGSPTGAPTGPVLSAGALKEIQPG